MNLNYNPTEKKKKFSSSSSLSVSVCLSVCLSVPGDVNTLRFVWKFPLKNLTHSFTCRRRRC